MYQLTLTPNRDPGPQPYISLLTYESDDDGQVWAIYREWHLWPGQWALVTYRRTRPDAIRHEHCGPTIRTTTRMQLIADGVLRPAESKRWRKSAKAISARDAVAQA